MNIIILVLCFEILPSLLAQQCTQSTHQRCLCLSSTPYCPCSALTPSNSLNFLSSYRSKLVAVASRGCRPCPPSCLRCSSPTLCSECLGSFQLINGSCIGCPINCQSCSNGVCSLCISGYYLDYQTVCQSCPIAGTKVCTISSLISCLSNYWLDNNAANCISCDPNCQTCSSTTRCAACLPGNYLRTNFTCAACPSICASCTNSSCLTCLQPGTVFDAGSGLCVAGGVQGCVEYGSGGSCAVCNGSTYLSGGGCLDVGSGNLIKQCLVYALANGSLICANCTAGYFNASAECIFGCSILCQSCYGPHFGLCHSCVSSASLYNLQCIPTYNLNGGSAYQLFYSPFISPAFFSSGNLRNQDGCIFEDSYGGTQISFALNNMQSYQLVVGWKVYIVQNGANSTPVNYSLSISNALINNSMEYTTNSTYSRSCSNSAVTVDKQTATLSPIANANTLTISLMNNSTASIFVSQVLVVAHRCGGVQGSACLECSSTAVCTKCVNPNDYVSGHTCVQSCLGTQLVRTATRTCLAVCPSGTYTVLSQQLCLQCLSPCLTCSSSSVCLTCITSHYLLGSECLSVCPSGYYSDTMRRACLPCLRPCLTCASSLLCLSCLYGFYQNATQTCVLNCGSGLFGNLTSRRCQSCLSPCLTCLPYAGSVCLSCLTGWVYHNSQCLGVCPEGYLIQNNGSVCAACASSCLTCAGNSTSCTSCRVGTYLSGSSCISTCPSLTYANSASLVCQSCPLNCSVCLNSLRCLSCISPSFLYPANDSCLTTCPSFYFGQQGKCLQCQLPCLTCSSQSSCLSCSGLFLYNNSCLSSCPLSYYSDLLAMECLPCNSSACLYCLNAPNACTKCSSGLILYLSTCISNCPNGSYPVTNANLNVSECYLCPQQCLTCFNSTYCDSCASGYILSASTCSKTCPSQHYLSTSNNTGACLLCPGNCSTCTNSSLCTSCLPSHYLSSSFVCLSACPSTQYPLSGQCYPCLLPCLTCTSSSLCLSCQSSFLFNGSCLSSCPLAHYSSNSSSCLPCSPSCLQCTGSSSSDCNSCQTGMYLRNGQCLGSCGVGYYGGVVGGRYVCWKCQWPCLECTGKGYNCSRCVTSSANNGSSVSNLVLVNGRCLDSCPQAHYLDSVASACLSCPSTCSRCTSSTRCLSCLPPSFLTPSFTCQSTCPSGYFPLNLLCRPCLYPCLTCSSLTACLTCSSSLLLYQTSCLSSCPSSTFLNTSASSCQICPVNCSACTANGCTQCSAGVLVNGSCVGACPKGYYEYYSVCAPCAYGCLLCSGSSTCLECSMGYLHLGVCLENCPSGFIAITANASTNYTNTSVTANTSTTTYTTSNNTCQPCISNCLKCITTPSQCLQCVSPLLLHLFTCTSTCPFGSYSDHPSGRCITCSSPCSSCTNGFSCLTCIYGYILYRQPSGSQCIQGPTCPNSYLLNTVTNQCVLACPSHLYLAPEYGTCSMPCPSTLVLSMNECLRVCPAGMWIDGGKVCQNSSVIPRSGLPVMSCRAVVVRNVLVFQCSFNVDIANLAQLKASNLTVSSGMTISEVFVVNSRTFRVVTSQNTSNNYRQQYITLTFTHPYQLYSSPSSSRRLLQSASSLPVQNTYASVYLQLFNSYSKDQRRTGLQLMQLSSSICLGALILWLLAVLKNIRCTSLSFVCTLQWLHSLSLLDMPLPPNLGQFLEGFGLANFVMVSTASGGEYLWVLQKSYREGLWGIRNYFDFRTTLLPSLSIFLFFGAVYVITKVLYLRFRDESDVIDDGQVGERKSQESDMPEEPSLISNIPSKKNYSDKFIQGKSKYNSKKSAKTQAIREKKQEQKQQQSRQQQHRQDSFKGDTNQQLLKQEKEQEEEEQKQARRRVARKCKILNDRFHFNYLWHCLTITASPLAITTACQLIAPSPLPLTLSLLFSILFLFLFLAFLRYLYYNTSYASTKYCFLSLLHSTLLPSLSILSTVQIYLATSIFLFLTNIYLWNRIFKSKRSLQLRRQCQLNEVVKCAVVLLILIGYARHDKWSAGVYYHFGWAVVAVVLGLVVAVAVQATRHFFDQRNISPVTGRDGSANDGESSVSQNSNSNNISVGGQNRNKPVQSRVIGSSSYVDDREEQPQEEGEFFSEEQSVADSQSSQDIIDFNEQVQNGEQSAPVQLLRLDKIKTN